MEDAREDREWLTSSEAQKAMRISPCHLMHLRESGHLRFKKQGNAFFYAAEDVKRNQPKVQNLPQLPRP